MLWRSPRVEQQCGASGFYPERKTMLGVEAGQRRVVNNNG